MLTILQHLAAFSAILFAGAALYINVAEHPARMALQPHAAALQWAISYRRATLMQAPLALISCLCGTAVWYFNESALWFVAALLIGSVVPFTFVAVMPTNRRLLNDAQRSATDPRALLRKWNQLHAVRTALSFAASLLYLWCLGRQ